LKNVAPLQLQQWAKKLLELGLSWQSFCLHEPEDLVKDLVSGEVPLFAGKGTVALVTKELTKRNAPLAVFWDVEKMPLLQGQSGSEVMTDPVGVLAQHGHLGRFWGQCAEHSMQLASTKQKATAFTCS
jgi:hypothetical protein